ncbi:3-oxoacyl-ACP reductase [Chlorella sorokiniana]|uniref:3-oxoacyl-ACP reductase n=1 Tax=Chlorella sorokiniana TaxID=3076 RepID=A0A2P6TVY8_CHLSO|nr:3-oxoacyl-ACP reductase [Chlorella sorokiniana]|eukprot:PRW58222.1 3-oxoacyl-ACP reductase [Chlorella sorokiniana]
MLPIAPGLAAAATDLAAAAALRWSVAGRLGQSQQHAAAMATVLLCGTTAAALAGAASPLASLQNLLLLGAAAAALTPGGAALSAVLLAAGAADWWPGAVLLAVPVSMLAAQRAQHSCSMPSSGCTAQRSLLKQLAAYWALLTATLATFHQLARLLPPPAGAQLSALLGFGRWQPTVQPLQQSSEPADTLAWVGARAGQQQLYQHGGPLLPAAALQPGLGLHWYLLAQAFPQFRPFFQYVLAVLPAATMLPLALRFPARPDLLLAAGALLRCILHPQPRLAMAALWAALLPLGRQHLGRGAVAWFGLGLAAALMLMAGVMQLWLGSGGGNANFVYGMNLLWGGLQPLRAQPHAMSTQAAAERLARLAAHLETKAEASSSTASGLQQQPTATAAAAAGTSGSLPARSFHQRCFNFEPGRLLLDQVAIVTGAGAGIGKATAILFAQQGAKVVCSDMDAANSQATADFIRNSCGSAISVPGDVTDPELPPKLVAAAVDSFGGLHILVNCAGFTWDGMLHKMPGKQWQTMLDVHCTAPFRLIQAAAPHMRDAAKAEIAASGRPRPRCILNVSSVSGVHGSIGQANYATAKAGVVGLTKAVAKEWGPFGVRCNCLTYGYINTRLVQGKEKGASIEVDGEKVALGIPQADGAAAYMKQQIALARIGTAEEAAGAMLMLASPYASYISGQSIEVTGGGWLAPPRRRAPLAPSFPAPGGMARDATFSDLPDSLLARILVALVSPEPGEESHEAEPLLSSIGQLTGLTWLDFLTPGLTPPKIQLTQLTQLRHLRLYGGKLQPPGLAAFPRLSSYDLEHVGFGGDSALRCAMSRGGMLWLNGTGTQPALKTCRRPLQPAVLNALLPQGCSALLPLTRLELSCCELPIEVAACSQLSSLVALRLCECHSWDPLPPGDNADGSDSDSDDESIVLEAQLALSSTTLTSLLRQAPGLAALSIEDSLDAECATLQSTELPPGLTSFSLRGNDLSGVFEGPYPPALVDLDLGCNEFTRLPPQVLECTGLTRLALDGNDDLALTSAEARRLLSRLPQLVRLELGAESLLTPRVRQTLLEGRPDLQLSFTWGETESEGTTSGSSSEEEEDEL